VTKAARELARKSHKDDLLYSLDLISDLFIQVSILSISISTEKLPRNVRLILVQIII
jgi:hypothetical protein